MAGDPTAGKLSGGFLFKMYGLPAAAIAIWHSAAGKLRESRRHHDLRRVDLVPDRYHRADRVLLHVRRADPVRDPRYPAGPAFPICILLGMRDGTSFSHGLIDFIVLSGNSSKIWLFPIVGIVYGLVYYTIFRVLIAKLDLKTRAVKTPLPSRLHRAVPKCPRRWFSLRR